MIFYLITHIVIQILPLIMLLLAAVASFFGAHPDDSFWAYIILVAIPNVFAAIMAYKFHQWLERKGHARKSMHKIAFLASVGVASGLSLGVFVNEILQLSSSADKALSFLTLFEIFLVAAVIMQLIAYGISKLVLLIEKRTGKNVGALIKVGVYSLIIALCYAVSVAAFWSALEILITVF